MFIPRSSQAEALMEPGTTKIKEQNKVQASSSLRESVDARYWKKKCTSALRFFHFASSDGNNQVDLKSSFFAAEATICFAAEMQAINFI